MTPPITPPITLDELKPGGKCRVKRLTAHDRLGQRLMDMGLYPGLLVKVIRNAPLKDPMEVEVDGFYISLRHAEASFVEIDVK